MTDRRAVIAERRLSLLGRWRLDVDGHEIQLGGREQRLASLLALRGRRARLEVAGILWPESTDTRALASLRRALLLTQQRSPGLLSADRSSIGLDTSVRVDLVELRAAIDAAGGDLEPGEARTLLASLSRGDLLPGWYDDWLIPEREQLAQLRVGALVRMARRALDEDDLLLAVDAARAATAAEPLLESAREVAIMAHLGRGDAGYALREFAGYRDALRDELGVAPSRAITQLVERALPRDAGTPRSADPPSAAPIAVPRPRAPIVTPSVTVVTPPPPPPPPPPSAAPVSVDPPPPAETQEPVTEPATPGNAGPVARILALAVAVLVVAACLAALGLERGPGSVDGGETAPALLTPPADRPRAGAAGKSQVLVSSGDTSSGGVRFLMRATLRPTEVRLVVRGPSGASIVRSVVVRRREGRRLVLGGLDPGTYTWVATSPNAPRVSGQVTIAPEEVVVATGPPPTERPTPATVAVASAPSATPSVAASPTPSSNPPAAQPPAPKVSDPTGHPSPSQQAKPRGRPTDPGTQAPTPVG